MHYGARAKAWITDHDVKQKMLAKEFQLPEASLSNYLTGRSEMPVRTLVKIAEYFHLSMDYLVGLSDQAERPLELSKEERELVEGFRALRREQRELIMQNVRFMYNQNRKL